ncbi:hypothetical protein LL668_06885 [Providencia rettgeri]|uniref:hypothetical protein n=1 Tax=Providencia rettgeri TaxID=587 RepID=UPI001E5D4040|nr:hypothetical protein [Providencia rettgeri]UEK60855.1 hypothetical protein LL668_06885 [Providencia rettgeri]
MIYEINKISRLALTKVKGDVLFAKSKKTSRFIDGLERYVGFTCRKASVNAGDLTIELEIHTNRKLAEYLASEAFLFYQASLASYERAQLPQPNNASWQVVELYYSAYYAAHFILRSCGKSISQINKDLMDVIECNYIPPINNQNISGTFTPGMYYLTMDDSFEKLLAVKKDRKKSDGGSHKELWLRWSDLMDELLTDAMNDIKEYNNSISFIKEHKIFCHGSGEFSPSKIRSDINYRFIQGTWFFEGVPPQRLSTLTSSIKSFDFFQSNSHEKNDHISKLIKHSLFIIELANSIFDKATLKHSCIAKQIKSGILKLKSS